MGRNNKGLSILNTVLTILILACVFLIGFNFIDFDFLISKNELAETNEIEQGKTGVYNVVKQNNVGSGYSNELVEFDNSVEINKNNERNNAIGYYYDQLSSIGKTIYDTILNSREQFINGKNTIEFDIKTADAEDSFQTAWDAFSLDRPEFFWVDTTKISWTTQTSTHLTGINYKYSISPKDNKTYYLDSFTSENQVRESINKVDEKIDEIVNGAKGSNFEKARYVHDALIELIKYDQSAGINSSNIYGALVEGLCVCEGYAESYKIILDKLNIPCVIVYGEGIDGSGGTEAHAWNYVRMEDGKWYAVDTTWDDPIIVGSGNISGYDKYKYFLKGSKNFEATHIPNGDVSGTGQNFSYPNLSEEDYKQ